MKKSIFFVTTALVAAMLLAGCKGTSSSNGTTTPGAFGNGTSEPSTGLGTPSAGTKAPTSGVKATSPASTAAATAATTKAAGTPAAGATAAVTATVSSEEAGATEPDAGRLSNLLKFDVWDSTGNKLGTVKNVIVNFTTNKVDYIVISYGGTLGIGAREVAVPPSLFKFPTASASTGTTTGTGTLSTPAAGASTPAAGMSTPVAGGTPVAGSTAPAGGTLNTPAAGSNASTSNNYITIMVPKTVLDNAPKFDENVLPVFGQPAVNWDSQLKAYWSQNGATGSVSGSSNSAASTPVAGGSSSTPAAGSNPAAGTTPVAGSTPAAGGTPAAGSTSAMKLQGVVLADKAIGMPVANGTNSKIGEVNDLVMDTTNYSLLYVVISYKGGTTSGTVLVPIPPAALKLSSDGKSFVVADETILSTAPNFTTTTFPSTMKTGWDKDIKTFWQSHVTPSLP